MDMSPLPLYWVAVKGEPDETSQKKELVDFKETIMGPESPDELKCSSPMEFSTQQFCSATFKSELEEVDTDVSFKTSPETEVIDSKEIITRELVPELPKELKYSPPVDLSLDPFSSEDVKIEPEEIDPDLSYNTLPRSEEEDLMTEMPGDIINGNSSDGTSPNCASYSMPSSSGGVGELPTIGNLCTSKDEIIAPYACSLCSGRFRNKLQLRTHLHSLHNIKSEDVVFSCSICDNIHLKRTEFMKHILEFHPRMNVHICPVCREVFHAYWDLHEHLSDYSDNVVHLCARCGEMFPARSTMEQYMEMEEEYSSRPKVSVIEFYEDFSRNQDIKTNTKEIEFYKDSPRNQDIKTSTKVLVLHKDSLSDQDINAINANTKEIFTYDVCAKSCSQIIAFAQHRSSHSRNCQLACSRCEQKFATQSSLLTHLRAHESRPHMCGTCNMMFSRWSDLLQHVTTHYDYYALRCSKCQKCFTTPYDLKRHRNIHKGACTSKMRRLPIYFHRTYAPTKK